MNIFILRHGEAGTRVSTPNTDFERPLTQSGREEIEEIAESLHDKLKTKFDKIATSPLARAFQTAEIVSQVYKKSSKLETWAELRPEGSKLDLERRLSKLRQDSNVLLVGHEPFLSSLITEIVSEGSAKIALKKGGVAKIRVSSFSPKATGELRWLLTPKQLKKM
ncbi:MAG: phosphohistidine phosphatase SixA [Nitrososphaerales archaeon]